MLERRCVIHDFLFVEVSLSPLSSCMTVIVVIVVSLYLGCMQLLLLLSPGCGDVRGKPDVIM